MATFCTVCTTEIPEERDRRRASTCSEDCKAKLTISRRARKDAKVCRFCQKPSTPEERKLFMQWRREQFPSTAKRGRPFKNKECSEHPESTNENAENAT